MTPPVCHSTQVYIICFSVQHVLGCKRKTAALTSWLDTTGERPLTVPPVHAHLFAFVSHTPHDCLGVEDRARHSQHDTHNTCTDTVYQLVQCNFLYIFCTKESRRTSMADGLASSIYKLYHI